MFRADPRRGGWSPPVDFEDVPCAGADGLGTEYVLYLQCADSYCLEFGDLNRNGLVNFQDLLAMVSNFGECPDPGEPCWGFGALNGDGAVGFEDRVTLLANSGPG